VTDWIKRAENESLSFEDLGWVPEELATLDLKLNAAIYRITMGELKRAMSLRNQRRIEAESRPLAATQALRLIYESLKTTESLKVHNTVLSLSKIQWLGDANVITFRNNFVQVVGDVYPGQLTEQAACDILLSFFDKSARLSPEAQHWRRMNYGDPNRSFDWLLNAMDRECLLQDMAANVECQEAALKGMMAPRGQQKHTVLQASEAQGADSSKPQDSEAKLQNQTKALLQQQQSIIKQQKELQAQVLAAGVAPGAASDKGGGGGKDRKGKGKGKGKNGEKTEERKIEDAVLAKRDANNKPPCFWHYTPEGCRREGDCDFSHSIALNEDEKKAIQRLGEKMRRSRSSSRESKGKGKGKGKNEKGKQGGKDTTCRIFTSQGSCPYGDKCRFTHC